MYIFVSTCLKNKIEKLKAIQDILQSLKSLKCLIKEACEFVSILIKNKFAAARSESCICVFRVPFWPLNVYCYLTVSRLEWLKRYLAS